MRVCNSPSVGQEQQRSSHRVLCRALALLAKALIDRLVCASCAQTHLVNELGAVARARVADNCAAAPTVVLAVPERELAAARHARVD